MSGKLSGKIALVTGGSKGIGFATAKCFVAEGASVLITGRNRADLDAAVAELGSGTVGIQTDSANLADLDRLFETIGQQKGHLDVLFANAGGGELQPLGSITEEHFDKTFNTNVKGTLFTVQKALPLFKNGGSIILNVSTTSIMGTPAFSVYSATKAALRSLVRCWILDLKGSGIRINALSPGATDTPGLSSLGDTPQAAEAFKAELANTIPLGRLADPTEIGKAAVFLASDDSSYINGVELFVDGGLAQV